jgi:hypothetical protein
MGTVPAVCELSGRAIIDVFIDGRHPIHGSWACWHPDAFAEVGGQLGLGRGQRYERQPDGRFWRTEG